jgi:hypothetical protein
MWYKTINIQLPRLQKYNFRLPGIDADIFDISLLIFENHPHKDEYVSEFEKTLTEDFCKG